jgi:hypothetical protein
VTFGEARGVLGKEVIGTPFGTGNLLGRRAFAKPATSEIRSALEDRTDLAPALPAAAT